MAGPRLTIGLMYLSSTSLAPALPLAAYFDPAWATIERQQVLAPSWHPVATADQLAAPGQFVTTTLLGVPVVVRRFGDDDGTVVALRNVCAHRSCTIVEAAAGQAETLRCPYHGWEYGADGLTRKIPKAKNFPHFDRDAHRLDAFAVARSGGVWWVRLADGPSLDEQLGQWAGVIAGRTEPPRWKPTMIETLTAEANWKIPLEGSLESYHLPDVHAATFGPDSDPGEEHSDHTITPTFTSFATTHRQPSLVTRAEDWAQRRLGVEQPDGRYEHHHLLPNLMLALTESITLLTAVVPTGPATSELRCWQWGRQADRSRGGLVGGLMDGVVGRGTAFSLGRAAAKASLAVLKEDVAIFPRVQRGIEGRAAAEDTLGGDGIGGDGHSGDGPAAGGVLGRCEERLHAFQQFVADRCGGAALPGGDAAD